MSLQNAFGDISLEATQQQIKARLDAPRGYDPVFDKQVVGTARDKFRDEFFTFDTTNAWQVVQTGAGQTITTNGVASGSRYLNIATGTTINSETVIQSRQTFRLPVKLAFGLSMSQRIINQEVFVELVGVDESGNVETDATFASTNLNNATNALAFKFDSTTATSATYIGRAFGVSELASANSAFVATTAATGTSPNFLPAGVWEINADMEEAVWQTRAVDAVAAVSAAFKRTQNLPDPLKAYKVRIRVRNLGTAPASSTDVRFHFVRVLDTTRFTVDFARHMGRVTDIADSLPVAVSNSPAVTVSSGTITSATVLATPVIFADTTTNLAASATFTGTSRDGGAAALYQTFKAICTTPTDGIFRIENSTNGTTWYRAAEVALGFGGVAELSVSAVTRYHRVVFNNGGNIQTGTAFAINSMYQRI